MSHFHRPFKVFGWLFALVLLAGSMTFPAFAGGGDAAKRWRKAAEQGDAVAQYTLGWMYAKGCGVPKDYTEAVKWCRKATKQGYVSAQYHLGVAYANGQGVYPKG